jgi:hypothetical protein
MKTILIENSKTIGFYDNTLNQRGTSIALYDYAYYNETMLNNKSIIIYNKSINNNDNIINKFKERFENVYQLNEFSEIENIEMDVLYIIKYGKNDDKITKHKTIIQCISDCTEPHGNIYTSISKSVYGYNENIPIIPHIIPHNECLRKILNIPESAIIFGRYGGCNQFEIPFVNDVIRKITKIRSDIYFLFANTLPFSNCDNIIYLDKIINQNEKIKFINTCDAIIWTQSDGETFGLSIGEFSSKNKPVIANKCKYLEPNVLGEKSILYTNSTDLEHILLSFKKNKEQDLNVYREYNPLNVMKIFHNILSKINESENEKFYLEYKNTINNINCINITKDKINKTENNYIDSLYIDNKIDLILFYNKVKDNGYITSFKDNYLLDFCEHFKVKYIYNNNQIIIKKFENICLFDNFTFISKYDQINYDIYHSYDNIFKLLEKVNNDKSIIAVNTFGFMKNKIEKLTSPNIFKNTDGIFIKKQKNDKIRIKMICNWCSSKQICKEWNTMFINDMFDFRYDDNNIDYYVIINKPFDDTFYIPSKTILFQMEPWIYDNNKNWGVKTWGEWSIPDENKFMHIHSHKKYLNNVQWQIENILDKYDEKLDKVISILSEKNFDEGHIKRINLVRYKQNLFNIYGRQNYHNLANYVGQVKDDKKENEFIRYKYVLSVENNWEHNYATEKIWEPILCECLCFYWGCPNLEEYIDSKAFVRLDLDNFEKSIEIIETAIRENWWEQRIDIIRNEKEKIINELSFSQTINKILGKENKTEFKKYI